MDTTHVIRCHPGFVTQPDISNPQKQLTSQHCATSHMIICHPVHCSCATLCFAALSSKTLLTSQHCAVPDGHLAAE